MAILITGGAGYIGSHTCVDFLEHNEEIIVLDNFSNSTMTAIESIKKITNKNFKFYQTDILDIPALRTIFTENVIDAVIHFAGLKSVNESVEQSLEYYENNVCGTVNLLKVMKEFGCKKMVFSSSASVYGDAATFPVTEKMQVAPYANTPYGTTKSYIEHILMDLYQSDSEWSICILRYFNPIGAHESGLIGDFPNGIPNNLMPYITKVASKQLEKLSVFGNDYPTKDGTGVRDFIHVVDLASGHLNALTKIRSESHQLYVYNLGTGNGYTVLELVKTFEKVNHIPVSYEITNRRDGDIAISYADPKKAEKEIGFKAKKTLEDMCRDHWHFEQVQKEMND